MKIADIKITIEMKLLKMPIKHKFFFSFVINILLVVLIINLVAIFAYRTVLKSKTIDMASESVSIASKLINLKSRRFEEIAFLCVSSPETINFLYKNSKGKDKDLTLKEMWEMEAVMDRSISYSIEAEAVYLVAENGTVAYKKRSYSLVHVNDLNADEQNTLNKVIESMQSQSTGKIWTNLGNSSESVYFGKKIVDISTLKDMGYFVCELSSDYFNIAESSGNFDAYVSLTNNLNEIIYSSSEEKEKVLRYITENGLDPGKAGTGSLDLSKSYMYMYDSLTYDTWKVFCIIPANDVLLGSKLISFAILLAGALCIIIAMYAAYLVSGKITQNIRMLDENMSKVENEDFYVRIKPVTYDETGMLALRFNYMANKIAELNNTVSKQAMEQQRINFQVMQAQISPHFLYNTLGSIKWMAHSNNQVDIQRMTTALINLLKAGINKKGEICTVSQELEYVEDYVFLQNMRYGERFKIDYLISDETEEMLMLPFLIQPIVENSIYHGFDIQKEHLRIVIETLVRYGSLIVRIIDNGIGMEESTVERIFSGNSKEHTGFNNLGIRSVNERVKLYFGESYGVEIESRLGEGSCVSIKLPAVYNMEADKDAESFNS